MRVDGTTKGDKKRKSAAGMTQSRADAATNFTARYARDICRVLNYAHCDIHDVGTAGGSSHGQFSHTHTNMLD
jgi:hypothetical protein